MLDQDVWGTLERAGGAGHDVSDEPRDETGKWTTGGGGGDGGDGEPTAFISPNVSTLTFNQAVAALKGSRQQKLTAASKEIDTKLGIKSENHPAIGAWADGAENSLMVVAHGASTAQIRAASAMKGYLADQKAVLVFNPSSTGENWLARFDVSGKASDIHNDLLKDGLAFHTLQPLGDNRFRVHAFVSDEATIAAVDKAAARFDAKVKADRGDGEFIGTTKETGTDREQRDDAKRIYEKTIQEIGDSGALGRHDVGELWDQIRDHWSPGPGKGYSAAARVDEAGVIHTPSVYDAQRALFENRKVELEQPKTVSTLIHLLGESAAKMAAQGKEAPVFNLCNVSIEGTNLFCSENKGIPRAEMPVIAAKKTKEFVKYLKSQGYKVEKDREQARHLRATQDEISGVKVAAAMERIEKEGFYKRLVISRDDYILDGHHTWAGQLGIDAESGKLKADKNVKVYRVDISITKLLEEANKWTGGKGKKPASEKPKFVQMSMAQASRELPPQLFRKYFMTVQEFFAANTHLARSFDDELSDIVIVVRVPEEFKDGVFVRAHVSHDTADQISAWAKTLTLPDGASLIDPNEYHATLVYSKTPFDYEHDTYSSIYPTSDATNKHLEILGKPENTKVLTLRFDSHDLTLRHNSLKEQGAVSDFPDYKPHITIAESLPADHDVSQYEVYSGPIEFTSESAEPIERDFAYGKDWDESKHPRVPAGSSEGGQFGEGGGSGGGEYTQSQLELWPGLFPPAREPKKTIEFEDFSKDHIEIDRETEVDEDKKKKFVDTWNERVQEAPAQFRDEFLGGMKGTMRMEFDEDDNTLEVGGKLQNEQGETIGTYTRVLDFKQNKAVADYFALNDRQQGKSIGKRMLAANVAMYQKLGFDRVDVHANIDVGGYAWAKYGYVPTQSSWNNLGGELLEKIGGGGYEPESWGDLSSDQQDEIRDAWKKETFDEFETDVENFWREDGGDLAQAKTELAGTFDTFDEKSSKWAYDGLSKYAITVGEGADMKGIMLPKFLADKGSSIDAVLAATIIEYDDRRGDGSEDPDVTIDDTKTPELTDRERKEIEGMLVEVFNKQAEHNRYDIEVPDLSDRVDELQNDAWENKRDREKFRWASDNDALPKSEPSDYESGEAGELRALADDGDPKAIWAIADSDRGKDLLLQTDWNGSLDLNDEESMARFNAYVGKEKPHG